ncbi:MAG: hypothetical protein IJ551_05230 [Prevotella sp.]|nr:hypothetical protein [Prevotella sp.]
MNTKEVELLKDDGFSGFKTIAELRGNINMVPAYGGVYVLDIGSNGHCSQSKGNSLVRP